MKSAKQILTALAAGSVFFGGIFGLLAAAARITTEASFSGANGAGPYGDLLFGADGGVYGTTYQGGTNGPPFGYGTVFRLTPTGGLTTLVSFNSTDGSRPYAGLVQTADGRLFGTTLQGGAANLGVVYSLTTNGNYNPLVSFTSANGAKPSGRLTIGHDGFLYGTTQAGGISNFGTVFRITTNGVLSTLASFFGTNGANPYAGLAQGLDGHLYGTTVNGGSSNLGTVFRITTNGTVTVLTSFSGTNGQFPYGGLTQSGSGDLYGTTAYGGPTGAGTVFRITTNGVFHLVHAFAGGADGANPWATLVRGKDGYFYGSTILGGVTGGVSGWGTVFQIAPNDAFASLWYFDVDSNGISPYGSLAIDPTGALHGTTSSLGAGLKGTVFRLNPAPGLLRADIVAQTIRVSCSGWMGQTYQIQYKPDLTQGWLDLGGSFLVTNGTVEISNAIAGPSGYYRIKQIATP